MRSGPRLGLQISIVLAIAAVVSGLTAAIAASIFLAGSDAARLEAERLFSEVTARLEERVGNQVQDLLDLVGLTAALPVIGEPVNGPPLDHPAMPVLLRALAQNEAYYSAVIGFADGSLLQAIAARGDPRLLGPYHAPPETWTMLRAILAPSGEARREVWTFIDRAGAVLAGSERHAPAGMDPRDRPWYQQAASGGGPNLTDPYLFSTLPEPGFTASAAGPHPGVVFGIHVTLRRVAAFVAEQSISAHGGMVLLDRQRRVVALSPMLVPASGGVTPLAPLAGLDQPLLAALAPLAADTRVVRLEAGGTEMLASMTDWSDRNGKMLSLGVIAPFSDFTAPISEMQRRVLIVAGLMLAVMVPLSLLAAGRIARTVTALADQARRIEGQDFSAPVTPDSAIREVADLSRAFALMTGTLAQRDRALAATRTRLERLVELALVLAAERDPDRLLEMVLAGAKELAGADGGTVYRRDGELLRFEIMRNDSLGIEVGGPGEPTPTLAPVPLTLSDGRPNHGNLVSHAVLTRRTVAIDDAEADRRFDLSATRAFDQRTGYRSRSLLTVPLLTRDGEAIGALQLINARDSGGVVGFGNEVQRVVEALAAQAATALSNHQRLEAQDRLIEAMARTLARALDDRGGGEHCTRVPELSMMLTEAAARTEHGPLAAFTLTAEQWREVRIGAWLHDCGKITTPDFLLDKATRLETVHNRIHEIRTRFELLWRDARIARLEAEAAGTPPAEAEAAFLAETVRLREDFAFVAACNLGTTEMTPARIERLRAIAARTWMRHFDDRLGLSPRELRRLAAVPPPPLPTPEPLLADRPHQVVPRRADDLAFGSETERPPHLYDFGELHCLSVRWGTLTAEERAKVNEHAGQTVALLESLPFPPSLARVPEQAGAHHETLTGNGYPRHLSGQALSVPARILAIADRFEILTATPDPDGRPPRLSQAVQALAEAKRRGEIDPDLFDLMLTADIHLRYAERFLPIEQIDSVEIAPLLGAGAEG